MRLLLILVLTQAGLCLGLSATEARTWSIRPDGTGDTPTIQAAIDSADAGDIVMLAPGTYTWTSQGASGTSMIRMRPGITLTSQSGAESTVLDGEGQGRVIYCQNVGQVTIDGCTIQNGQYVFAPIVDRRLGGAGVLADEGSDPTISNCIIRGNRLSIAPKLGAGVACVRATIVDCQILDNVGFSDAAGLGVGCVGELTITRCTIRGHRGGGDASALGGGLWAAQATMTECRIEDNQVFGIYSADGAGAYVQRGAISNSLFLRNIAQTSTLAFGSSPFGGGLWCGECTISDCVFVENAALGGRSPGAGGAIGSDSFQQVTVTNCTLIGNRAAILHGDTPPGLRPIGGIGVINATVVRTIIAGSEGLAVNSTVMTSCSNFFGNSLGDSLRGVDGGGNFSADPLFCAEDPVGSLEFTLRQNSPCAPEHHPGGASCGLIGAADMACGPLRVESTTWSRVKSLYRE